MSEDAQAPAEQVTVNEEDTAQMLESLKLKAQLLKIPFHPNIGIDKLREKIKEAEEADVPALATTVAANANVSDANKARLERIQAATKLVRVKVTCLNPNKREWAGELFTGQTSEVNAIKKYVPFDNEEGWHVPNLLLDIIRNRKCQVFKTVKHPNGNTTAKPTMINEFAVVEMEPLNQKQINDLAKAQAAGNRIGQDD